MIKNAIFFITIFGLVSNSANAREVLIEGKAAYFLPQEHKFRKIYPDLGIYGAELSWSLCQCLYGWVSVDSVTKRGSSLDCHRKTKLNMVPVDFGLKYFLPYHFGRTDFYVGGGLSATYVKMHDHSPYVVEKTSKWGVGGIGKIGSIVRFSNNLFLDLFINYSYVPMDFHCHNGKNVSRNSMNFGGWAFGLGFGYKFCR